LSDTKVYEPEIRALLETASQAMRRTLVPTDGVLASVPPLFREVLGSARARAATVFIGIISQKVFVQSFYVSQFPQKFVNLSFILVIMKDE